MTFQFREAKRENVPLLLGLAGGTGSGKTWTAMALAKGLAGAKRFVVIDTENGRAKHYADDFAFDTADLVAPFRPERYSEAIQAADSAGYPVIVVDSMSHEWAGDGGLLDWHEEEFQRLGGRDAVKMTAWIKPKMTHRKFVTRLLQVRAHVILCFRAAERIEMVRKPDGKMEVVPKRSLTGLDGWQPITEKDLPYELLLSVLLTADAPGVPKPIKLPAKLRAFFPLDVPVGEETGRELAAWAAGGSSAAPVVALPEVSAPVLPDAARPGGSGENPDANPGEGAETLSTADRLIAVATEIGAGDATAAAVARNRAQHAADPEKHEAWLGRQLRTAEKTLAHLRDGGQETEFARTAREAQERMAAKAGAA